MKLRILSTILLGPNKMKIRLLSLVAMALSSSTISPPTTLNRLPIGRSILGRFMRFRGIWSQRIPLFPAVGMAPLSSYAMISPCPKGKSQLTLLYSTRPIAQVQCSPCQPILALTPRRSLLTLLLLYPRSHQTLTCAYSIFELLPLLATTLYI